MGEEESVKECTDHRAWNDASRSGCTERRSRVRNYGGNYVPSGFSGISKKQFTDFSWRSDVEENWRTTGQSTAFHAAPRLTSFRKFFRSIFRPPLPHLFLSPWHSSLESVHFVGIKSWFRRGNNIINLNFTSFVCFFFFLFTLLRVTLIFLFIVRTKIYPLQKEYLSFTILWSYKLKLITIFISRVNIRNI